MKPNLGFYVQTINEIVTETENIGEKMHTDYAVIREAIDQDALAEITSEQQEEIKTRFEEGTAMYRQFLKKLTSLRPPAAVMGVHKKFERSYEKYVKGCEDMIASITNTINVDAFNAAEDAQDEASSEI